MTGRDLAALATPRRRRRLLLSTLALTLFLALASACTLANEAQDLMNNDRQAHGLRALPGQVDAYTKAQNWAEHMAAQGRISHSNLTSGLPAGWTMAGENVGCGGSLAAVQQSFMASSGHRANILNPNFTHAANGVAQGTCRTSSGHTITNAYFVVQVFVRL